MDIVKRVKAIKFSPVNPEEFKKYATCEILNADLYDKNKEPVYNGINDPRMGPVNKKMLCETCEKNMFKCPGHFGYTELKKPVYNPIFIKKVAIILNAICTHCNKLLINKKNISFMNTLQSMKNEKRLIYINKINSLQAIKKCYSCGKESCKFTKDGMILIKTITQDGKKVSKENFYGEQAYTILSNLTDEDIKLIGLNPKHSRPEWLLFTVYPVIPPCIRPSINFGCNLRCEDDLVYKLVNLIKQNRALENKLKSPNQNYLEVYEQSVQWHLTTLINNNIKTIPQSVHRNNKRQLKSLTDRIKGKNGRLRGNILGKRVNYSARTVIGPDPVLKIDEVGIPFKICKILTFAEVVNVYNIKKLQKLVRNGPDIYPGANYIVKNVGTKEEAIIDLKYTNKESKNDTVLQFGDIVRRHLDESDHVLFNRQPSLHKMSMMAHRVRPIQGKSFRLNPSVTKPYNADFDGDKL